MNGNLLWKSLNGKKYIGLGNASNYPGARSTPTVVENLVYSSSAKGRIACYEIDSGKEKWAIEMVSDLGGYENKYGYSESLVVNDSYIYCFPGGQINNLVCLNRYSGKLIWSSKALGDTTSYCSPIIIKLNDISILVTLSRHYLFGIDCKNGNLLWSYKLEGFKHNGEHCNTPIYADGYIYNVTDSVKMNNGSIIFADNKFICYGKNGEIDLINYEQNKFEVTGKFKIEKGNQEDISHPVLSNGIMYIRHGNTLMAYKIK